MTRRALHSWALVAATVSLFALPAIAYLADSIVAFVIWVWLAMVYPMCLAAYGGGNPYSPDSWMADCRRHGYRYYRREGCHYCASEARE